MSFYAYVDNNPLGATDPSGMVIVSTAHDVGPTSWQHLGYRIYPEDEKFARSQLARVGRDLVKSNQGPYFTVSAGPGGFLGSSLVSKVNSQGDAYSPVNTVGVVTHSGQSENQVIEQMIDYHEANNKSPQSYDYWPFNNDRGVTDYNSNSYYIGLGNELSLTQPANISSQSGTVMVPGQGTMSVPNLSNTLPTPSGYNTGGCQGCNPADRESNYYGGYGGSNGGYLLYPSRSNTNIQSAVYAK